MLKYIPALSSDPIIARRQLNQHNLDCLAIGTYSRMCVSEHEDNPYGLHCAMGHHKNKMGLLCNRCAIRNEIEETGYSFIGYSHQTFSEADLPTWPNTST